MTDTADGFSFTPRSPHRFLRLNINYSIVLNTISSTKDIGTTYALKLMDEEKNKDKGG